MKPPEDAASVSDRFVVRSVEKAFCDRKSFARLCFYSLLNGCIINGLSVYHVFSTVCQELPDVPRFSLESGAKKAAIPIPPVAHAPNAVENAVGRLRLESDGSPEVTSMKHADFSTSDLIGVRNSLCFWATMVERKRQYETLNPTLIDV